MQYLSVMVGRYESGLLESWRYEKAYQSTDILEQQPFTLLTKNGLSVNEAGLESFYLP